MLRASCVEIVRLSEPAAARLSLTLRRSGSGCGVSPAILHSRQDRDDLLEVFVHDDRHRATLIHPAVSSVLVDRAAVGLLRSDYGRQHVVLAEAVFNAPPDCVRGELDPSLRV